MYSVIVPLVKNRSGDLSNMNNYGAIAVSNVLSKIFESVLLDSLQSFSEYDKYQFGFKTGCSSTLLPIS